MRFFPRVRVRHAFVLCSVIWVLVIGMRAENEALRSTAPAPVIWRLDNLASIGGLTPEILGVPEVVTDLGAGQVLRFNGESDGLLLPAAPLEGWDSFTIEIVIKPALDGGFEQRFFHTQAEDGPRALLELRLNPDGMWYLDTFLGADAEHRLALIDPAKLHPAGRWYHVAATYDGRTLTHYINGVKQGEGQVRFPPMKAGKTSLGVRQTRVSWYKGLIREVAFYPGVRPVEALRAQAREVSAMNASPR